MKQVRIANSAAQAARLIAAYEFDQYRTLRDVLEHAIFELAAHAATVHNCETLSRLVHEHATGTTTTEIHP